MKQNAAASHTMWMYKASVKFQCVARTKGRDNKERLKIIAYVCLRAHIWAIQKYYLRKKRIIAKSFHQIEKHIHASFKYSFASKIKYSFSVNTLSAIFSKYYKAIIGSCAALFFFPLKFALISITKRFLEKNHWKREYTHTHEHHVNS